VKTQKPTIEEIDELLAFLPKLYAAGFVPVRRWSGGEKQEGAITMPWPEYDDAVSRFFQAASASCWNDPDYNPAEAGNLLRDEATVSKADLDTLKTLLTFCVRGERFCDGHWGAMIEEGHVRRLLERLADIRAES
jgi:hypothetical protein